MLTWFVKQPSRSWTSPRVTRRRLCKYDLKMNWIRRHWVRSAACALSLVPIFDVILSWGLTFGSGPGRTFLHLVTGQRPFRSDLHLLDTWCRTCLLYYSSPELPRFYNLIKRQLENQGCALFVRIPSARSLVPISLDAVWIQVDEVLKRMFYDLVATYPINRNQSLSTLPKSAAGHCLFLTVIALSRVPRNVLGRWSRFSMWLREVLAAGLETTSCFLLSFSSISLAVSITMADWQPEIRCNGQLHRFDSKPRWQTERTAQRVLATIQINEGKYFPNHLLKQWIPDCWSLLYSSQRRSL